MNMVFNIYIPNERVVRPNRYLIKGLGESKLTNKSYSFCTSVHVVKFVNINF